MTWEWVTLLVFCRHKALWWADKHPKIARIFCWYWFFNLLTRVKYTICSCCRTPFWFKWLLFICAVDYHTLFGLSHITKMYKRATLLLWNIFNLLAGQMFGVSIRIYVVSFLKKQLLQSAKIYINAKTIKNQHFLDIRTILLQIDAILFGLLLQFGPFFVQTRGRNYLSAKTWL